MPCRKVVTSGVAVALLSISWPDPKLFEFVLFKKAKFAYPDKGAIFVTSYGEMPAIMYNNCKTVANFNDFFN